MDEPSSGLDPASRKNLWKAVKSAKQDRTIILTSTVFDFTCHHEIDNQMGKTLLESFYFQRTRWKRLMFCATGSESSQMVACSALGAPKRYTTHLIDQIFRQYQPVIRNSDMAILFLDCVSS